LARHCKLLDQRDPKQREALTKKYCRGWFLGSAGAKKDLAKDIAESNPSVDWEGVDLKELNALAWERIVQAEMKRLAEKDADVTGDTKGADWKVTIAKRLKKETPASYLWIVKVIKLLSNLNLIFWMVYFAA